MLRYLSPNDYGLFVIPFLIYNLLKTFQDLGSHDLIFRSSEFNVSLLQQILGFTLLISLIIIGVTFILPDKFYVLISKSFQTDRIYLWKLAPLLIITAFNLSFEIYCRKSLQFKLTAVSNLISTILGGLFGIYLAMNGFKTDSLVYKQILYVVLYFIVMLLLTKGIILPSFRIKPVWKERDFYLPLFTSQILAFASRNLDNILVGKFLGVQKLGIYDRAYKFLSTPLAQIGGIFHKVLLPILTNLNQDKSKMLRIYNLFLFLISLISFPFLFIFATLADEFVMLIFGVAWIEAIPIIQIFSIAACFQSLIGINHGIILLSNKTKQFRNLIIAFNILYYIIFLTFTTIVPDIFLLVLFYSIGTLLCGIFIFKISANYFNVSLIDIFKPLKTTILLSLFISVCGIILKIYVSIKSIFLLIIISCILLFIYAIIFRFYFKKEYFMIVTFLKNINLLNESLEINNNHNQINDNQ